MNNALKNVLFTEAFYAMEAYKGAALSEEEPKASKTEAAYVALLTVIVKAGLTAEWNEWRREYRRRMEEEQ